MNNLVKSTIASLVLAGNAFAADPANGWYLGGFGGASFAPSVNFDFQFPFLTAPSTVIPTVITLTGFTLPTGRIPGKVTYNVLANGGIELGYRCNHFRYEAEFMYVDNTYKDLTIGRVEFPGYTSYLTGFGFKGNTAMYAGLFNLYYDFFSEDYETSFMPYVGLGIGYGNVQNTLSYYFSQIEFFTDKKSTNVPVGQIILGISYLFGDDAQWTLGTDFRYMITNKLQNFNQRFSVVTWNFVLNYTFDEP